MSFGNSMKPYLQRPSGVGVTPDMASFFDWVQVTLNALVGQQVTNTLGTHALDPNTINPSGPQITSIGARPASIATAFTYVAATTSITFYWDGTHGSTLLKINRDDGTTLPAISGSYVVTNLTPSTLYYFYPYWQENVAPADNFGTQIPGVNWGIDSGIGVGKPAVAFTSPNLNATQTQISRDHIPLALRLATTGISTTGGGTATGSAGGGGGGVGGVLASVF